MNEKLPLFSYNGFQSQGSVHISFFHTPQILSVFLTSLQSCLKSCLEVILVGWNITIDRPCCSSRVFKVVKEAEWKSGKVGWRTMDCSGRPRKFSLFMMRAHLWYPCQLKKLSQYDFPISWVSRWFLSVDFDVVSQRALSKPELKEADAGSKEQLLAAVGKAVFPFGKCTDKGIVVTFHVVECTRILHPILQAANFPIVGNSEILVEITIEPTGKKPSSESRK
ncbi:hypothetical protein V6N11_001392 [Hibiscus sabdariffa]|uniref:Uncharacterized protein n=1 Tax=Hibiscus sabdariffa TaxID=183260 RepID=A0ABR2RZM0_9ROSI